MSYYKAGKRTGKIWNDLKNFDQLIKSKKFTQSVKNEKEYLHWLDAILNENSDKFSSIIKTETDRNTKVDSVYCFGRRHRPDMSIGNNAIVIELKYIKIDNEDEFKKAIGQLMIYRIKYKFGILFIILSDELKELYNNIVKEKSERDFVELINYLAKELNIYTYVIPDFKLKPGIPKIYTSFKEENFK